MADEIELKAPTVEQQVVVNINGEEKLRSFADTLDKISNNKNLQKYWKTQQELINATANAYGNFQKKASKDNATELIKVTNALKAMSGTDLSNILPDFDKISKAMAEAQKVVGNIDSAFSVKGFKEAFDSFETLKAYSEDIEKIFSHFGVSSDVGELQNNVRALEGEVEKLTRRLANAKNANEELRNEFNNFKSGSGFADKLDELDNLKSEMSYIREEAEETFRQFLKLNNVSEDGYDRDGFYDDNRFREYFQNIQSGYMSASDAIRQFKTEYSYLLEESFKTNNDTFGLEQLQAFSNKLDSIFRQVEETSTKINDIISNGVITKSVENLSIDSSLSDSQRSLFGNLLQDEESLKSITALFQKLIEESNKTSKVDLFNDEQLQQVLSIFDKMEGHLSSLRSIISDVGDGEEFSPLLKMINNVQSSISKLATSVKGIGLNMNIDVGSNSEMEAKVQSKIANALQAYQRLFDHIKMSSAGGQIITDKFFDFDINQYDTMMGKLQGYKKFIDNMRKEAKAQFNGQDVLYQDTEKSFWTQASSAAGQVTKVFNEMKAASSTNPLADMFSKTDLSEVISQLGLIVAKLEEISTTASSFKNAFANGFNVTASVKEIDKLTNRVKELEDELSKIKLSPVNVDKSNISSDNIANQIADKENSDHDYWQKEFERTMKELSSPQENPVLDDMRKFYQDQDKENSKIWNDNLNKIKEYLDARTKLNKLESANVGKGDTENIIRQRSEVKRLEEEAENARATLSKLFSPYKRGETPDDAWIEMMKNFRQATDGSEESVARLHDSINKFNASELQTIDKYIESAQKKLDSTKSSKVDSKKSSSFKTYEKEVQECINALIAERDKLENAVKSGDIEIIDEEFLSNFNKLKQELEETNSGFKTMFKGSAEVSRWKEIDTITKYMEKNTRISKEAKDKLREYIETLKTNGADANVEEIHKAFLRVCDVERKAKREGQSFLDVLRNKVWYQWAAQIGGYFGFNDIIRYAKEGIQTVREFDTALTEMRKVSDEPVQSLKNYQAVTFDVANEVGATAVQIQNSASDWMRLGESIDEAAESAKASNILLNVSEFDNIDDATSSLVSMGQAYKDLDKIEIVDKLNEVGNNYAISTDELAVAMQKSAATLSLMGNSIDETASMITTANSVLQDADTVSAGLRTISLRIVGKHTMPKHIEIYGCYKYAS